MRAWPVLCLLFAVVSAACGRAGVEFEFYSVKGHRFTATERRAIQRIARATAADVRRVLPGLPAELVLRVEAGSNVIPETGETGMAGPPNVVVWTVNPDDPRGVRAIVHHQLRATLAHEFHHLARAASGINDVTRLDGMITEGLATAFERDFTGARPPWGAYPDDVDAWASEVLALPGDAPRRQWMFLHPDGRRWIGYKVGTYLVDRAIRSSRRSAADLVATPADEIVRLARTP